jgi:hypothetical protein
MSDIVRVVRIDDTHRVTVYVDQEPQNPRTDFDQQTGALTVRGDSRRTDVEPCFEFPGDLRRAHDSLVKDRSYRDVELVMRWARIFYDISLDCFDGTYWWVPSTVMDQWTPIGTYEDIPLYTYGESKELLTKRELELRIIASDQLTYQQWADGEVYGLAVEELKLKAKLGIDENDDLIILDEDELDIDSAWRHVETVWGFYLDAYDDAAVITEAKEMY